MKELTARMARVQDRAAELSRQLARHREMHNYGPLQEVRDLRPYSSIPDLPPRRRRRRR
jgi:hypothetical protein